jgi:hypothetical protein
VREEFHLLFSRPHQALAGVRVVDLEVQKPFAMILRLDLPQGGMKLDFLERLFIATMIASSSDQER